MSTRKVTLKLTTQKDLVVHQSSARTFGELKAELTNISWSGMRVVERESKNTLQIDEAILPAGDFILFLVPEKVKSGSGSVKKINLENASYNELRSHASLLNRLKKANISLTGKADDLRKALKKYYAKAEVKPEQKPAVEDVNMKENSDAVKTITECKEKINQAIDEIIKTVKNSKVAPEVVKDTTEYVVKLRLEDLENELKEIKSSLKL